MRVLVLDPGVTTGWIEADILVSESKSYMSTQPIMLRVGQDKFIERELYEFMQTVHPQFIICEDFEYRQTQGNADLFPVRLIGIVHYYSQEHPVEMYWPKPYKQSTKMYFDDKKLKEMGLWTVGKEHTRSAMRHFLQWFTFDAGYKFNVGQEVNILECTTS